MKTGADRTRDDLIKFQFALPADEWIIVVKLQGQDRAVRETISCRALFSKKYIEWFRARNANGCHIYGRPYSTRFVLIDDVIDEGLAKLKSDGLVPSAVVETSPDNFQVWLTVSDVELSVPVATQIAKLLEREYSTDNGSAEAYHLGRLPGLRNKKPKYQKYEGDGGPLVLLRTARTNPVIPDAIGAWLDQAHQLAERIPHSSSSAPGACAVYTDIDDEPIEIYERGNHVVTMSAKYDVGEIKTAYDRILDEMKSKGYTPKSRHSDHGIDRSFQDIAVAGYLIRNCVSRNVIADVLANGSDKAAERGAKYVEQTVRAACSCR